MCLHICFILNFVTKIIVKFKELRMFLNKGDVVKLQIDNITSGGEGIGRIQGYPIFVANTAIGDNIEAEITLANKKYGKANLIKVLEPSADRIEPKCKIYKVCGSCQWHHIGYEKQLEYKKNNVIDCFNKFYGKNLLVKDVISSDNIYNYRCKIQYPVRQTKNSKRIIAGYYKENSHELVNVKYCPIQPEIIDQITEFLRTESKELDISAYNEKTKKGLLRHFVFRYGYSNDEILFTAVVNANKTPQSIKLLCENVFEKFPEIKGSLINFNTTASNLILTDKFELITGKNHLIEELQGRKFKISAGSFFQVNPSAAIKLFNVVENMLKEKINLVTLLDVYAGVGSFSIWLKDIVENITAVEYSSHSAIDAQENIKLNNCEDKINYIEGNADNILSELVKLNKSYEVVLLDPPRKGCSPDALKAAANLAEKNIIYVSCNPATLARDTAILEQLNFNPEYVQPVDMFCQTHHVECVVMFNRAN